MESVQDIRVTSGPGENPPSAVGYQAVGFLIEMSLDWIVLRASENAHRLLDQSHVTLIDEPLGKFARSQPVHDLRNVFSRLSGTTGIARAYRVRLTDEMDLFDIAFQVSDGRVLLEAVHSPEGGLGEALGSVGGLIAGLSGSIGDALLDAGARRMRALTGCDRVTLTVGDRTAESSRGTFAGKLGDVAGFPAVIADSEADSVSIFPRDSDDTSAAAAILRSPTPGEVDQLRAAGVGSMLSVPIRLDGEQVGTFRCERRKPSAPNFELHAAAELFAQLFAQQLEIDRLRSG